MDVKPQYKQLCENMVKAFHHKLEDELNSPVYQVAALLQTRKLKRWQKRAECVHTKVQAIDRLKEVRQ